MGILCSYFIFTMVDVNDSVPRVSVTTLISSTGRRSRCYAETSNWIGIIYMAKDSDIDPEANNRHNQLDQGSKTK